MQKGKTMQYAMAGVQAMPGMRMNVRSHVYVPDAEAGEGSDRQPYYAASTRKAPRRAATIPANIGIIFLCAVFLAFAILVLNKACQRAELSKRISAMESGIAQTITDNSQLTLEVMAARDSSRICYAAAQEMGMVAATGVEAVQVMAPDTRPSRQNISLTGDSPSPVWHGMITGSR